MDNLESMTYEIFEKDPVKYTQYKEVSVLTVSIEMIKKNNVNSVSI